MFAQTEGVKLVLPCKDCHRSPTDSETVGYQLIRGRVLRLV
jgi:hypothetical protein